MSRKILIIKYTADNNNFCYLSLQNFNSFKEGVLKVERYDGTEFYFTSRGISNLNNDQIGLNCLQARALGLEENENVMVSRVVNVPSIKELTISPCTVDDYEMVNIYASKLEYTILNQIRVVNTNQKFVIFVSDSIHMSVNVDSVNPVSPGVLDNFTNLCVAYPQSKNDSNSNLQKSSLSNTNRNALDKSSPEENDENVDPKCKNNIFAVFENIMNNTSEKEDQNILKYFESNSSSTFRLYTVEELNVGGNFKLFHHFTVFANEKYFDGIDSESDVYTLKCIMPSMDHNEEGNNFETKEVTVRVCVLKDCPDFLNFPTLYVHQCIFDNFKVMIGAKAILKRLRRVNSRVTSIEIITKNVQNTEIENLKRYLSLSEKEKLILNSDVVLQFNSDFVCSLKFSPSTSTYCVVNPDFVRNCNFCVTAGNIGDVTSTNKAIESSYCEDVANFGKIIQDTVTGVQSSLSDPHWNPYSVMFTGKSGSGKSSLIEMIKTRLCKSPFYVYSELLSCKNLKGKSLDSLQKQLESRIEKLIFYQPSVLILDDLQVICEATNPGETVSAESLLFERVSEMFANLYESLIKCHRIAIIGTSESLSKLNQHVYSSRGQHLFKSVVKIEPLTKTDRLNALKYLFGERCVLHSDVNTDNICLKSEGFVMQDLVDFADKAVFECIKEGKEKVTNAHCELSLTSTMDLSLKDVNLHSPGEKDFSDIGGLENAKKELIESMMWPLQFPNIFDGSPLRIQSGLLLYGPPGTGKTVLAAAAAKQCGLRLISVKGPELLSKYIGASEQSVRDVFEKAQSAKPCILFFDEFDSLAPRRGHDSTGVTDRVVNQILTQLDGVESLNGVCVLAATSKPELLDPALLRPGRLDKQIFCPLPDKDDRFKILKAISKKFTFTPEVDLLDIANKTEGFTGADLQAVLRTAQLSACDSLLEKSDQNKSFQAIEINENHVDEALKSTRPSVSRDQQKVYNNIYSKFQQRSIGIESTPQRTTLA